ncbi:disease resistance protein RPM1-like [Primulina huaijiensis]|uniref:disease resistance protein RPM1-like n=1 Tax=Primulina huaijiensis TaxID=1492673 RepID=UPI003CC6DE2E
MAECLTFVLEKLTDLLEEKVNLVNGARRDVEYVRDELERIISFLRNADSAGSSDPELDVWVRQVRVLAHDIEDIVDNFMHQIPDSRDRFPGNLISCLKKLKTRHQIASEIREIKSRMKDVAERHQRYGYLKSVLNQGSSMSDGVGGGSTSSGIDRRGDALLLEEGELVGIDDRRKEVIFRVREGGLRLRVVSVVGMGGSGKTTLVKKVFDDDVVKKHFHNHAWITVSESFKMEELLKDMIQQLYGQVKLPVPLELGTMTSGRLKAMVKDFLRQRKFLLVFDDVWSAEAWEGIKHVLPDEEQGSRVIITTRFRDTVENDAYVYELDPLSEEDSWTLFCQKVFRGDSCPAHLVDICKNILRRCGGLPLAIVAISGVLSTKKVTNIDQWRTFMNGIGSELEGNDRLRSLKAILLLSFNHLPYYLKPCFMYLSKYPEDHLIEHNTLIRLWIAEGFVKQKEGRTLEEVAEGYLNELINRSLIRPMVTNDDGSVKSSCIHDLYRELIVQKSSDQNLMTLSSSENILWPKRVRRLSIHGTFHDNGVERYGSRLCSLQSFGAADSVSVSGILQLIGSCKLLKVLDLRGIPLEKCPEIIFELFHLKYLCLRNSRIKRLPGLVKNLRKLEVLDLKETKITKLPTGILKLQHLRQLLVYHHVRDSYMPYNYVNAFKALKGIGRLKSLQKLGFIEASRGGRVLKEIASMTKLRKISLTELRAIDSIVLCTMIEKLRKITSLGLRAREGDILDLQLVSSPPPFLQRLYLNGRMQQFPHWIQSLSSLVKIYMRWSQLREDPLQYLQDLPNLVHIEFLQAYTGQVLRFKTGKFQKLKLLGLDKLETLKSVIFEEGTSPLLEKLIIQRCNLLESIPFGIEHLANMKVLEFFDMPGEFIMSDDEHLKVKHIPKVYLTYWRDGFWEVCPLEGLGNNGKSSEAGASIVRSQEQRNWL